MRDVTLDQQTAFVALPNHFTFTEARLRYGRKHQATLDFLRKMIEVGELRTTGAGYEKTAMGRFQAAPVTSLKPAPTATATPENELDSQLLKAVKNKRVSVHDLSEVFDRSQSTINDALKRLRDGGFNIELTEGHAELSSEVRPGTAEPLIIHPRASYHSGLKLIGVLGDNHLGSKHERLDVLNALYDVYEDEGVTEVLNTGNWIEGEARFNRYDIKVYGLDRQVDYFIEHYPQRKGITTRFVAGDDHEGWYQQREQIEIGRYAEDRALRAGRNDLKYLGYVEADIKLPAPDGSDGGAMIKVMHPGGGSAYALSYSAQKIVESFQGGEKPDVLLYGHYHKFDYNYAREVHSIGTACTVDQSIFMRKNKIQAHVGGLLLRLNQAPDGHLNRVQVEWMPFYDKGFYLKQRIQSADTPRP